MHMAYESKYVLYKRTRFPTIPNTMINSDNIKISKIFVFSYLRKLP